VSLVEPTFPMRPALPVTAFAFVGLWIGLFAALNRALDIRCNIADHSIASASRGIWVMLAGIGVVLMLIIVTKTPCTRAPIVSLITTFLLGGMLGFAVTNSLNYSYEQILHINDEPLIVQAVEDATSSMFGDRQVARIASGPLASSKIYLSYEPEVTPLELGQRATMSNKILPLPSSESSRFLFAKGVAGQAGVSSLEDYHYAGILAWLYRYRADLSHQIEEIGEYGGLTRGVLLGDRRGISREVRDEFGRAGLGHVLAVSGMHFAVVAGGFLRMLSALHVPEKYARMLALCICTGYVLITGGAPSALRAWGMLAVLAVNIMMLRRSSVLNSLFFIGIACLVIEPLWALSIGFTLSVCAVAGIGMFARLGAWYVKALFPLLPNRLASDIALACVALVVTLPIITAQFGFIPLLSPVSNVLVIPLVLVTLTVALLGAVIGWISPTLSLPFFHLCAQINRLLEYIVSSIANIPWSTVLTEGGWPFSVTIFMAVCVLWWIWPLPRRKVLKKVGTIICVVSIGVVTIVCIYSMIPVAIHNRLVVLDVGQGDALLVQSGKSALLIDAGPDPVVLRQQLRKQGVKQIDALIVTHDHDDHIMGAQGLGRSFRVEYILCAEGAESSAKLQQTALDLDSKLCSLKVGTRVMVGDISIDVWGPQDPVFDPSANESCLILYVTLQAEHEETGLYRVMKHLRRATTLQASSVLTSGDAEALSVKRAIKNPALSDVSAEVFKLGHHGSKASVDEELLELVSPEYVVVSVGGNNKYGHPAPSVLELCRQYARRILRTDEYGPISIELLPSTVAQ